MSHECFKLTAFCLLLTAFCLLLTAFCLLLTVPIRRQQTPAPICRQSDRRLVEFLPIPKLARDLPVRLVERFTVIRVGAATHFLTATESHFSKPVRIGERLARHANDVRVVVSQNLFG